MSQPVYSQKFTPQLQTADSLYKKKHYLQSLKLYQEILKNGEEYSPQMLLKMAYMEEALHRYEQSMYYLNLYYNRHPSRSILRKMEEVAQTNGLIGYQYRDIDFFRTQFRKYYMKLLELMLIVAVATVTIMLLKRRQDFFRKPAFQISFIVYLAFLFYYINFLTFRREGITQTRQAALMAQPSAGGKWLANFAPGNRLHITGETDIWYKVKWQDQSAFIRKKNLLVLPD
ncbi:SH3 domain-containing protein [Adhaeribacter sp. BT258]|uniref:SH3 domain-containing protein n=1 Tax=Adhaeribacter terrigena TaxID=2793070 RepID=A0ABS1C599_9BACT|nr:SH3 domain-containing protein [Adhaeribacter terrigena]MBK0404562.1 SH3 domain-containing protein [Adhaeribacter terrigena]